VEILYDELNIKEDDFITQQFSVTFLVSIYILINNINNIFYLLFTNKTIKNIKYIK